MAAPLLAGGPGTVSYGSVVLTSPFTKTRLTGSPVMSRSGRVIKYVKYVVEVSGYIIADGTGSTDVPVLALRNQLTRPGQILVYDGVGFGALLRVGPGQHIQDVADGPMPEMVSYETINAQAVKFTWRCTFCIPEQNRTQGGQGPSDFLAADWSWSQDIDEAGYITTHWDVEIEVGIPISAARTIGQVVDNFRDRIQPPLPTNFRRVQTWSMSDDRRVLKGSIVDTQVPVALPRGTALMNARHRVSASVKDMAFGLVTHNLTGTVTVPAGTLKSEAWQRFYVFLQTRINAALGQINTARGRVRQVTTVTNMPGGGIQVNVVQLPGTRRMRVMAFEADEDVFGKEVRFAVTFLVYGGQLSRILIESGLFASVGNFVDWNRSMTGQGQPFSSRGSGTLLGYGATRDGIIVDIGHQPAGNIIGS
jgi:hypothetical protein